VITPFRLGNWEIGGRRLAYILGLNVLESEELTLQTAAHLKKICDSFQVGFVFKASFDKANRSSVKSYRGVGMKEGLRQLALVKSTFGLPIITDVHEPDQCEKVAEVADILQIPAFLCRQTDLVVAAARAVSRKNGALHIKKGQFLAPGDMRNVLQKVSEATNGKCSVILCERGVSFGYHNLVVDFLGIPEMRKLGAPVTVDATHAVQLPGAGSGHGGEGSAAGGRRWGVSLLARCAVVAGADGIFLEFHPEPDRALCDGPSCLPLAEAGELVRQLESLRALQGENGISG
jgi:2-dehydro-3-deoxyphosphooctonate aldolase (KDO 8-P synthase)